MMVKEYEWDICPKDWKKNYRCFFITTGRWRLEKKDTWGKVVFKIDHIEGKPKAPTFADQRNFFTGLFEAEWKNDNFVFEDGSTRPPQREKKIQMFKEILEEIQQRADVKDTKNGLNVYFEKYGK